MTMTFTSILPTFRSAVKRAAAAFAVLVASSGSASTTAARPDEPRAFTRIQLSDQFWSEGASFGDLNNDGTNDVISGPRWWEGPDFKKSHEYYPATKTFD